MSAIGAINPCLFSGQLPEEFIQSKRDNQPPVLRECELTSVKTVEADEGAESEASHEQHPTEVDPVITNLDFWLSCPPQ